MAEEREKPAEEQEGQETQESESKRGLPINIIIICILVLCLIGGGLFVWKGGLLSKFSGEKGAATERETEASSNEIGSIYEMETFIVNLTGNGGNHYLKVKINLELDNEEAEVEINKRLPQFRDSILTLLSGKTNEEVKTLEGKSQIRAEIIMILNQYLKMGKVTNVYFDDFIVQ